jgi:succinyl-CoA synthetase alpha subunit
MQAFTRHLRPSSRLVRQMAARKYTTSASSYSDTIENLRVTAKTKVIFQGFTGKQGT